MAQDALSADTHVRHVRANPSAPHAVMNTRLMASLISV